MEALEPGIDVDLKQWREFARRHPQEVARAVRGYFEKGAVLVRAHIVDEAVSRFGVETAQSAMQNPDPSRPTGRWAGSVAAEFVGDREARIGPNVPYAWWPERGSRAPKGVPKTHRSSKFRGHEAVRRGAEASTPGLQRLLYNEVEDAVRRST